MKREDAYPTYPTYKDSGLEWLSRVPEHWEIKRLRFVAALNPSKSEARGLDRLTPVSFLPMEAIGDDGRLSLDQKRMIGEVESGYTYFREGDVTIAKITPCFENGKGAVMRNLLNGIGFGTTELIVARPLPGKTQSQYLQWLFNSLLFRKLGEGWMYGAGGQKRVPDDFVRDFCVAFPPLEEQGVVSAFLDRETAKIDELIAKQERLKELLIEKVVSIVLSSIESTSTQAIRLGNAARITSRPVVQREEELYTPIGLFNRGRGVFHKPPREMADMGDSDFFWVEEGDLIISGQFSWEGAVALGVPHE